MESAYSAPGAGISQATYQQPIAQATYQQPNNIQQNGIPHMPYGIVPYPKAMATILLPNGTSVSMPPELLEKSICNLTKTVQRTQKNNVTIALSVLASALKALLGLESTFRSILSKGDDFTLLANLNKCIAELQQANAPQQAVVNNPLACFVTEEKKSITKARELFEHCIKTIQEFVPCVTGRRHSSHEFFSQTFGWAGWKQQATQIAVHNDALDKLLNNFMSKEPGNKVFIEVSCFSEAVDSIIDGFHKEMYPTAKKIGEIYVRKGVFNSLIQYSPFPIVADPSEQAQKTKKKEVLKIEAS